MTDMVIGYAQITPDLASILKRRSLSNPPTLGPHPAAAKAYWVIIEEEVVDTTTGDETVQTKTQTIEASRVLISIAQRDMDAAELAAKDAVTVAQLSQIGNIDYAQFEYLFDHENRIRVLESRPTITKAQALADIETKLRP